MNRASKSSYRPDSRTGRAATRCVSASAPTQDAPAPAQILRVIAVVFALAGLSAIPSPSAEAQQPEPTGRHDEYTVKAVFLYSFGRNVEWPKSAFANASAPFVIGVLGEDPFGGTLDAIAAKKTIQGRNIVIRRFASTDTYRPPCHILFVSRSLSPDQQTAGSAKTEGQPVLLVGETPGFAERGAAVNFFVEGDRILFEINPDAARRAGLRMDAKLLKLGKPVGTDQALNR